MDLGADRMLILSGQPARALTAEGLMGLPRLSGLLFVPVVLATLAASLLTSGAARAATEAGAVDMLPILAPRVTIQRINGICVLSA